MNWGKGFWWQSIATNNALLQEGRGLALEMCGEAPWGLSRQALRRWQPLRASSPHSPHTPEFLLIGPKATSDWTTATAYCWGGKRGGRAPGLCPLPTRACRVLCSLVQM